MNENGTKKREWVKTAAIIFLSVLLVLTFFSNTIMNYSLPEVAAQYVESGTITAKIRGTGVIESGDPYEVMTELTGRTIESVKVKAGDKVEKGDVLFELKPDEESTTLKEARDAVETAEIQYENALRKVQAAFLTGGLSEERYQNIQSGQTTSYSEYYKRMSDAGAKVAEFEEKAKQIDKKIIELTNKKDNLQYDVADTSKEAKEYRDAKTAYDNKSADLATVKSDLEEKKSALYEAEKLIRDHNAGLTVSGSDAGDVQGILKDAYDKLAKLPALIQTIEGDVYRLEQETYSAELVMNNKKAALDSKGNHTGSTNALTKEIENWTKEKEANDTKLADAKKAEEDVIAAINAELGGESGYDLETPQKALADARENLAKLEEKLIGNVVEAPISGVITTVSAAAGHKTDDGTGAKKVLAIMQPEGKGFNMNFSVTNEQAKRLAVGDRADLVNSWRYDNVEVKLSSIKPDPSNPGQNKLLTFDVSGDVTAGQSLSVSVGDKSAEYDLIVPNSTIREDNNGKFVLIVEAKNSPLGTRYVATRVDIEVLASDDTKSAVSGALYGYEFVITTSTKPVEAGKLVRLADN